MLVARCRPRRPKCGRRRARRECWPDPYIGAARQRHERCAECAGYAQAAWWNRIPCRPGCLVALVAIACNLLMGYGEKTANRSNLVILPVIVAIAFALIADIDSPRGASFRCSRKPDRPPALAGVVSDRAEGYPHAEPSRKARGLTGGARCSARRFSSPRLPAVSAQSRGIRCSRQAAASTRHVPFRRRSGRFPACIFALSRRSCVRTRPRGGIMSWRSTAPGSLNAFILRGDAAAEWNSVRPRC